MTGPDHERQEGVMLKRMMMVAAVALGAAMFTLGPAPEAVGQSGAAAEKLDRIIFNSGRVVTGRIVEETETHLVVEVEMAFGTTQTKYLLGDVLKVEHDVVAVEGGEEAEGEGPRESEESARKEWDPDAAKIYLMELEGLFGSDISRTPIERALEDVNETFGDLVRKPIPGGGVEWVVDPEVRDQHILVVKMDCESDPRQTFNAVFTAEELGPLFEKEMQGRGRRVVFWIDQAADGASFLPWLSQDIFFTPEGRMGFQQDLEDFSSGDDMVDEKLISARLGHYHGFAIDGGYGEMGPQIINAMARSRYWLSYRLVGGKPELSRREYTDEMAEEGWILLTDNGKGKNKDKDEKRIRNFNDLLILNARVAQILGVSKGVAETIDDLAFELGVGRNYEVVEGDAEEIFDRWVEEKEYAFRLINPNPSQQYPLGDLWVEFNDIEVTGDYFERRRALKRQIAKLNDIRGWVKRFEEVWDPGGQFVSELTVMIEQIRKQMQLEKAQFRAQ